MKKWYIRFIVVPVLNKIVYAIDERMDEVGGYEVEPDQLSKLVELSKKRSFIQNLIRDIKSLGYKRIVK